jgi:hypothetical protein
MTLQCKAKKRIFFQPYFGAGYHGAGNDEAGADPDAADGRHAVDQTLLRDVTVRVLEEASGVAEVK